MRLFYGFDRSSSAISLKVDPSASLPQLLSFPWQYIVHSLPALTHPHRLLQGMVLQEQRTRSAVALEARRAASRRSSLFWLSGIGVFSFKNFETELTHLAVYILLSVSFHQDSLLNEGMLGLVARGVVGRTAQKNQSSAALTHTTSLGTCFLLRLEGVRASVQRLSQTTTLVTCVTGGQEVHNVSSTANQSSVVPGVQKVI